MLTYARGNVPWPWDTAWDQRAKMLGAISAGGGGGGGGTLQVFEGRAPAAPDDAAKAALNYPSGGGTLTQWNGSAWV